MAAVNKHSNNEQNWLVLLLNELSKHTMSIVVIVILFLLLWIIPQINDLIVVVNQADNDWFVLFIFFASLSVMGFLISTTSVYFRRLRDALNGSASGPTLFSKRGKSSRRVLLFKFPMDDKELFIKSKGKNINSLSKVYHETQEEYIERMFPKILGSLLIFIAAFAVNNTYFMVYGSDITIFGDWGLLVCMALLLASLNLKWTNALCKWLLRFRIFKYIPGVMAVCCLITILILGLFNQGGSEGDTIRLFYALLLLAIFFLLISTSYNRWVLKFKQYIGAPLILTLLFGVFVSYTILLFNPQALKLFTPLPIVVICIIGLYSVINLVKLLGVIWRIPLLGMTLFVTLILGIWTANRPNFSHFDATSTKTDVHPDERLDLDRYVKLWLADRKDDIQNRTSNNKFPIIFVSAEGGGSRAGLWSFLVQSYLYERNPDYFKKYLFAMTGASGGGVGNNMFYTQAHALQKGTSTTSLKYANSQNGFKYRASSIYNKDYLSTSVAGIMGRDFFKSITNFFTFKDRGALLEEEWETSFNTVFAYNETSPLAEPYLNIMPRPGQNDYLLPIIVTNTTHLQSGQRTVVSPIAIKNDTHNMSVFKDLLAEYPIDSMMIKRSTAMSMNARFPYISPAARIKGVGQFGDAGYYDNIGGTVTRRLADALKNKIEQDTSLTGKYVIKHLLITHFEEDNDMTYSTQLTAPLSMIWNATFAHPKEMEKTFANVYNIQSKRTEIASKEEALLEFIQSETHTGVKPFIPLGRYLSDIAVKSLEKCLEEISDSLDRIVPPAVQ